MQREDEHKLEQEDRKQIHVIRYQSVEYSINQLNHISILRRFNTNQVVPSNGDICQY